MTQQASYVGFDLDKNGGSAVEAIIEAIRQDNEGTVVDDFGVYYKVKAPARLIIKRESVEEFLGQDWEMDQMHIHMASYFGFLEEWDEDQIILQWNS